MPNTVPNDLGPNSSRASSGGNVMRLPTPRPKTRLAATSTAGEGHAAIAASAAPCAPMFTAESLRRSTRSESTPRTMRPSSAATVVALTVSAARLSPSEGSSTLIWCTRNPTCAASARGERHHQRPEQRDAQHLWSRPDPRLARTFRHRRRRPVAAHLGGDLLGRRPLPDHTPHERQADPEQGRGYPERG